MQRKKILWLVSWYPNINDRFDGDFVQRHARAAAIYNDVHVIMVTGGDIDKATEEDWYYVTGLTEQIIYFKKKKGLAARWRKQATWRNLYQDAIKSYIEKNGLPNCIHVHVPWKAALIALWMKKKYKKEFIVTEHWGGYNQVVEDNFFTKPKLVQHLLSKSFQSAKAFVSVSHFLGKGVQKVTGKSVDVLMPNVVDTSLFFFKDEKYSRFTFIHVSNMVPLKNIKGIIDAFKNLLKETTGNAQLVLVGNKDNEYPNYAESLGLLNTSVFFRGEVTYNEVAKEMQQSHCFILNSVMENSPCVIGEALCCGLPVIVANVGGVPELVNDSNSILVETNSQQDLKEAMKVILDKYAVFDQKQIAYESSKKFGYSAVAQQFRDLYDRFC